MKNQTVNKKVFLSPQKVLPSFYVEDDVGIIIGVEPNGGNKVDQNDPDSMSYDLIYVWDGANLVIFHSPFQGQVNNNLRDVPSGENLIEKEIAKSIPSNDFALMCSMVSCGSHHFTARANDPIVRELCQAYWHQLVKRQGNILENQRQPIDEGWM